jgi:hypothetical protein
VRGGIRRDACYLGVAKVPRGYVRGCVRAVDLDPLAAASVGWWRRRWLRCEKSAPMPGRARLGGGERSGTDVGATAPYAGVWEAACGVELLGARAASEITRVVTASFGEAMHHKSRADIIPLMLASTQAAGAARGSNWEKPMRAEIFSGIITCCVLALSADAHAAVTTTGTSFVSYNGQYEQYLLRGSDLGIGNGGSVTTIPVMGSVYHSVAPNGIRVYFDGFMDLTTTIMWCGVTSLNWDGTVLFSQNIEVVGYRGSFEISVTLTAAQAPSNA